MKEIRKNNYSQFVIRNLARYSLTALLGIILVGESVSAIPNAGVEVAQQQGVTEPDARAKAQQAYQKGMQLYEKGTQNDLRSAIILWEESLKLWQKLDDKAQQSATLTYIGAAYSKLGNQAKSSEYLQQAIAIKGQQKQANSNQAIRAEAKKLTDEGFDLFKQGTAESSKQALGKWEQALLLWRKAGDKSRQARTLVNIGYVYDIWGDKQQALKLYNQGLTLNREIEDKSGEAVTLNNIGKVYSDLGNKQQALKFYNQGLTLNREIEDKSGEAITLGNIGTVHASLGDSQQALKFFNQALVISREIKVKSVEATTINNIGYVYDFLGDKQQALKLYNQALLLRREIRDKSGEAGSLNDIATVYIELGDKQKGLNLLNQALILRRQVGDKGGEATTLNNIGLAYSDLGEYQKALNFFNQALPLNREVEDKSQEATTLSNIGVIYNNLGDKQRALDLFSRALLLNRKVGDKSGEAAYLNNIGAVYDDLGDKQQALRYYNQALSLSRENGYKTVQAKTFNNIGKVYFNLENNQQALKFYNQSLPLSREVGDKTQEATTLSNIGKIYNSLKDNQQALKFYNQALPLSREAEDKRLQAIILRNIAITYKEQGNLQTALTNSKAAVDIIENLRTKVDSNELRTSYFATVQDIYKLHIDILMQLHKQNPSLGYDAQALHASEKSRARGLLELLIEANADIRKGANPELLAQEKRLQQQIEAKEKLRLDILSDKNKSNDLISKAAAQRFKKEVQNHIYELNQLQTKIKTTNPKYAALKYPEPLNLPKIQQQLDKDTVLLQYSLGEKRSYLWKVTPDSLESYELPKSEQIETAANNFRKLLQDPSTQSRSTEETGKAATELSKLILAPVANKLGKKRLVIVGDDALQYIPFAALADLNSQPARDSKSLANSESPLKRTKDLLISKKNIPKLLPSVRFNGLQLLDWGLQPQAGKMLAKSLKSEQFTQQIIAQTNNPSPQKNLNYQPLLINHEIVHLPSASTIDILRKETAQRPTAPKTLAVLADPVFCKDYQPATGNSCNNNNIDDIDVEALQSSLRSINFNKINSLPNTRKEAEQILKLVSPENSLKAFDFDANYNWATQKQLSNYRYLHFATHGFVDPKNPELSGIVLSLFDKQGNPQKEGFLRLHELFNLNFPAELVVLSACQTGIGKEVKGEGLVGLTRGLMYAGAERVVVSLWNVKDDATALLMREFYQEMLQQGKSPATALREAQLKMWRSHKWQNPYSWAAFTIQGEWN